MLVCFDVDGVLVEVTQSYFRALSETVSYFLQTAVDSDLLLELKFRLNLNNDWDATLAGILFYHSRFLFGEFIQKMSAGPPDYRKFYQRAEALGLELPDYSLLIDKFEESYSRLRPLERLNISRETLARIKSLPAKMAVVTGRTREDLDYTFRKFSLYEFFEVVISEDELPAVEMRKPSSYPLQLLFQTCRFSWPVCYIGDTLADRQMVENFNQKIRKRIEFILYRHKFNDGIPADYHVANERELLATIKKLRIKGNKINR